MGIEYTFQRYEKKYFLTPRQYSALRQRLLGRVEADEYGQHTICNIYYDSGSFALARSSIEKPVYKEKLRVRSYGVPRAEDPVFVELKKKYDGVVYKRRVRVTAAEADVYLRLGAAPRADAQTLRELDVFMARYHPVPKAFLAYDRQAVTAVDDTRVRITFDRNIRWRGTELSLTCGDWGMPLLADERILMEVKLPGCTPLWLCRLFSELAIYPTSFSKYGTCYQEHLLFDPAARQSRQRTALVV